MYLKISTDQFFDPRLSILCTVLILGHFGSFLGHFGNFGSFLGQFGQFWVIFELFWVILGHFWAIFWCYFLWQNMPLCYLNRFLQLWWCNPAISVDLAPTGVSPLKKGHSGPCWEKSSCHCIKRRRSWCSLCSKFLELYAETDLDSKTFAQALSATNNISPCYTKIPSYFSNLEMHLTFICQCFYLWRVLLTSEWVAK